MGIFIAGTSVLFLFTVLEGFLIQLIGKEKTRWDIIITDLNAGHILLWVLRGLFLLAYDLVSKKYSLHLFDGFSPVLLFLIGYVFWDFCFYWSHRSHHTFKPLWAVHSVHHQSEYFTMAMGIRNGYLQALTEFPFFLPMAILGISVEEFVLVSSVSYVLQVYNHNHLVNKQGFLEYFMMTPSNHRVHHGINSEYLNKNHGASFVIWDKIFGTYQHELDDVKPVFGLVEQNQSLNPIHTNLNPLLNLFGFKSFDNSTQKQMINQFFIGFSGAVLFILLLVYVQIEKQWLFYDKSVLFLMIFTGTLIQGVICAGERWAYLLWPLYCLVVVINYQSLLLSLSGDYFFFSLWGMVISAIWSLIIYFKYKNS